MFNRYVKLPEGMTFQKQLGMSSSQLTNSMIFQRGSNMFKPHQTTNQTKYYGYQWISSIASYLEEHFSRGKCQGKPCRCGAHVLALP